MKFKKYKIEFEITAEEDSHFNTSNCMDALKSLSGGFNTIKEVNFNDLSVK